MTEYREIGLNAIVSNSSQKQMFLLIHVSSTERKQNLKSHSCFVEFGVFLVSDLQETISGGVSRVHITSLSPPTVLPDLINYVLNLFINALLAPSSQP